MVPTTSGDSSPSIPAALSIGTTPQTSQHRADDGLPSKDNLRRYQLLYIAAIRGDWISAERIFKEDPQATTARITIHNETALHVAASVGRTDFIRRLVELLSPEDLEIQDSAGKTCLHNAVIYGSLYAAEILVGKNRRLTQIRQLDGSTPLLDSAYYKSREVIWYLTLNTTDEPPASPFTGPKACDLILFLTCSGFYDIILHLLDRYPNLAAAKSLRNDGMLLALARKPSDFPSGCKLNFLERCIYNLIPVELDHGHLYPFRRDVEDHPVLTRTFPTSITYLNRVLQFIMGAGWRELEYAGFGVVKRIKDEKYRHKCTQQLVEIACREILNNMTLTDICSYFSNPRILHCAAENGVVEIISICLQNFPYLIWFKSQHGYILQEAIRLRREKVLNLMLEENVITKMIAGRLNDLNQTTLHLVAKLAPYPQLSSVSCPALQMQRELQWFEIVEEFVHPLIMLVKDDSERTARDLFTSEHKELLRDAERWMKDTSNSCMLVATLIATVVFAAAFTVPGGNIDGKGIPIFLNEQVFMVFAIFDALALFSSSTSILMFLSILTARYAEEDFLRALPKRLILGFTSLFAAIATMMVAFGATLHMVLSERFKWIFIPIIAVTSVPVVVFAMLQLPLFIYMVKSTYGRGIFHPTKIW